MVPLFFEINRPFSRFFDFIVYTTLTDFRSLSNQKYIVIFLSFPVWANESRLYWKSVSQGRYATLQHEAVDCESASMRVTI